MGGAGVRASVCVSTLSNITISKTNGAIAIEFYRKHHWGGGKAVLVFGADRFRTLVPMVTNGAHMFLIGENGVAPFSRLFYIRSISCLQVMMTSMRAWRSSKFGAIRPLTAELANLLPRKTHHRLIIMYTFFFRVSNTAFSQSSYITKFIRGQIYHTQSMTNFK